MTKKRKSSVVILGLIISVVLTNGTGLLLPTPAGAGVGVSVDMAISPPSYTVQVNDIFTLDVQLVAGSQQVAAAEAHIDFDPNYLEVQGITSGIALDVILLNEFDNTAGTIDYAAGAQLGGTPPSGTFTLATIQLKAKAITASATLTFVFDQPVRATGVWYGNSSILGVVTDGEVTIVPPASYLVVTGITDPVVAGTASSVTVTARDSDGNVATGYKGTIHFTSSDTQATLPGDYTFVTGDSGVKTLSGVILKTAGEQWVKAADTVTATITGQQTGITVMPDNMITIGIDPTTKTTVLNQSFTVDIKVIILDSENVSGVQAYISFDPTKLEVESITEGAAIGSWVEFKASGWDSYWNNTSGEILYAAAALPAPILNETFVVATIEFKALVVTESTPLTFVTEGALATKVDYAGESILDEVVDGAVEISEAVISKIDFTTPARTVTAGQVSAVMTIETQNTAGVAVSVTNATTINLSSTSATGKFCSDTAGNNQITSVTISSGANSVSFYYKDATVGTPTITADESPTQGWTAATQPVMVTGGAAGTISKVVFTRGAQTLGAGHVSAVMTIQTQDASGNPVSVTGTSIITLTSSSATGKFYSDAAGTNQITSVTISSEASFYYKDTTAGTPTITAAESPSLGWTDASQVENVKAAAASKLVVFGITDPAEAGTACSVTVTAVDSYGNTITSYTGTIDFTSSDGQATLPADYTFVAADNGVKTLSGIILKTTGEQSVTATDTVTATITGKQTGITVTLVSEALPSNSKAFPTYTVGAVLGGLALLISTSIGVNSQMRKRRFARERIEKEKKEIIDMIEEALNEEGEGKS